MTLRNFPSLLLLLLLLAASSASGQITVNGDWSDWFSYVGNPSSNTWAEGQVTLTSATIRTVSDEEGPTPGAGGQSYDIEQIFYRYIDNDALALTGGRLYIAIVTGFPSSGVVADGNYAGDLFLAVGGSDYNIALSTSTAAIDAARSGKIWSNDNSNWSIIDASPSSGSRPYRLDEGQAPLPTDRTAQWDASVEWGSLGPHNFMEVGFDIADFHEASLTNIKIHWTMENGADFITVTDTNFIPSAVPEPATTAVSAGLLILGFTLLRRRNRQGRAHRALRR